MATKRQRRATAMRKREKAIARNDIAAAKRHAITARDLADEMRDISGRERGQGTRYLGPSTPELREEKTGTASQTKYQGYNIGILGALGGDADYYKKIWTPEMQAYWAEHGDLPPGTIRKPVKELSNRYKNLLKGFDVFEGDSLLGGKGRGWQVGGPGGPAGETDYLAYRPGSEAAWKRYLGPELTGSLMRMKQPAVREAALSYLPGEQRDPTSWAKYLGMGGMDTKGRLINNQFQGAIPQGSWHTDPTRYATRAAKYPGREWAFSAPPSQMIAQPAWTAYDISPQAAGEWTGLLGDWAAPAINTTNLLGVA